MYFIYITKKQKYDGYKEEETEENRIEGINKRRPVPKRWAI